MKKENHLGTRQIFSLGLLVLAIFYIAEPCANAAQDHRPNIVLILCDDLGYADVGFNGSKDILTPELDKLARAGTVFSAAYVAHPFCGPSRMGMMTGRYPHKFGAPFNLPNSGLGIESYNALGIDENETLISTVLQRSGYTTGAVGKWHMGIQPQHHPNNRGFDDYYGFLGGGHQYFPERYQPIYERQMKNAKEYINDYIAPLEHNGKQVTTESEYLTDALSREAVRFIDEASKKDSPFFLYLAYNAPHSPLEAKEEDLAQFPSIKDDKRRTYAAMVYAVDRGVGRLASKLTSVGRLDNTLIVFLSDNGGKLGLGANNFPLSQGKGSTCEGGYRVPMFFHWPGKVPAGTKYHHPVSSLDFFPTFAKLAGADIEDKSRLDGKNIWDDLLADRSPRQGETLFVMRHRNGFSDVGARRDEWKICRTFQGPWKLFHIVDDIGEKNDLSGKYPDRLRELVAEAEKWSRSHTVPRWFDNLKAEAEWKSSGMPNHAATFTIK